MAENNPGLQAALQELDRELEVCEENLTTLTMVFDCFRILRKAKSLRKGKSNFDSPVVYPSTASLGEAAGRMCCMAWAGHLACGKTYV
jgi:hypothetical protein